MTNITDEKILEFCHAKEVWVWDDDPSKAAKGKPWRLYVYVDFPFEIIGAKDLLHQCKHFSLEKPQVFEDGAWYTAKLLIGKKICVRYHKATNYFYCGVQFYKNKHLTNIRRIPEELWEGKG